MTALQSPTPTTGTYPLRELEEFAVAEGFPDPRGWAVYGADRQRVGTVDDLLVDLDALVVRYLAVRLESPSSSHVLVPVGLVSTDGPQRVVLVELAAARVAALPPYQGRGPLARADEDALLRGLAPVSGVGAPAAGTSAADFYERPEFATSRFYGGFAAVGGAASAAAPAEVPAPAGAATPAPVPAAAVPGSVTAPAVGTPGNEVRIVAMREEAVVTTRRVVKEILVIKRRRVVEEQPVEYDLRTEHVDVQRIAAGAQPEPRGG